ncbi:MAG: large conductance mechanosensitive channel protein MscL [Oscillospiraceae bacterium]|nr:large conductance mechanosensitive channel protein MscL [Oscillospiraceae bacterium]
MSKSKGFMKEFKEFAMRGNVVDLAVGVIIGGAFQSIVTSLTENIINPLIGLLFQASLDDVGLTLNFGDKTVFFGFGAFVAAIINFIIMAFVIFCIVKALNKLASLGHKEEEPAPAAPTTKICPYCKSEIAIDAVKCPHCVSDLTEE